MEMEFAAEFTTVTARDGAGQIIRGKRTKRPKPCSPFGAAAATSSSSSTGGGGGGGNASGDGGCVLNYYASDHQSTAMSSEISTEEDEDMANCLIMLAQSVSPIKDEKSSDHHHRQKTEKLSSRRLTEMATTAASGKPGLYVYECKTCNRSFPSFQALGGHRASHKKPKLAVEEKKSASVNLPIPPPPSEYSDEKPKVVAEDVENKTIINNNDKSPTPPPGFIQTVVHNSKNKVHECSICGSEFLSGQALGGHMRRHRTTPPSNSTNQIGISMNIDDRSSELIEKSSRNTSMLSLDLNLPAPEVVDDVHSTYQFPASSSQQHLVFSAPALVDCHY